MPSPRSRLTETVARAFATYRATVIPRNAGPVQIDECKMAFYAGAYFLLGQLIQIDDTFSEAEAVAVMDRLQSEIEAFAGSRMPPRPEN